MTPEISCVLARKKYIHACAKLAEEDPDKSFYSLLGLFLIVYSGMDPETRKTYLSGINQIVEKVGNELFEDMPDLLSYLQELRK